MQRMIGVDFNVVDGGDGAADASAIAPGTLTVCDYIAKSWDTVAAQIPIRSAGSGGTSVWVQLTIERVNATAKRITVANNPLGTLKLQPWLEGNTLVAAEPSGFSTNTPPGHIGWTFTGHAAAAATVTVAW